LEVASATRHDWSGLAISSTFSTLFPCLDGDHELFNDGMQRAHMDLGCSLYSRVIESRWKKFKLWQLHSEEVLLKSLIDLVKFEKDCIWRLNTRSILGMWRFYRGSTHRDVPVCSTGLIRKHIPKKIRPAQEVFTRSRFSCRAISVTAEWSNLFGPLSCTCENNYRSDVVPEEKLQPRLHGRHKRFPGDSSWPSC
jgi:hypothetical protein